jgi:CBS domain-containing protein
MSVKEVMRREVPIAGPETSVAELARLMVDHRVPGVPIVANGELVGIVTEGDLIQREANVDVPAVATLFDAILVADAGESFKEELRHVIATTAGQLMTAPVISIRDIATISELATLMMQRRVNPVPVVDDGRRIVGLATRTGLVEMIARLESGAADADARSG